VLRQASSLLSKLDESTKESLTGEEEEKLLEERRARRQAERAAGAMGSASPSWRTPPGSEARGKAAPEASAQEAEAEGDEGSLGVGSSEGVPFSSPGAAASQEGDATPVSVPVAAGPGAPGDADAPPLTPRGDTLAKAVDAGTDTIDKSLAGKPEKQQIRLLKAEVSRLRKEAKGLMLDLEDAEDRLEGQAQELKAAGEAIAAATRRAAEREMELGDEMSEMKKAKQADRESTIVALAGKDARVSELEASVSKGVVRVEELEAEVAGARDEISKLEQQRARLQEDLAEAESRVDQSAEALRAELRRVERGMEDAAAQHSTWRREAQRREATLEASNAQLTRSLADLQRKLTEVSLNASQVSATDAMDAQLADALERLHSATGQLELERQHHYTTQIQVRNLEHEVAQLRHSNEDEQRRLRRHLAEAEEDKQTAVKRLTDLEARTRATEGKDEFEQRLETMSSQLLKKQVQLDDLTCEKAALQARLRASQQRLQKVEASLASGQVGYSGDGDEELGTGGSRGGRGGGGGHLGLHRRTSAGHGIAKLPPFAKHKRIAKVADTVDQWSLWLGVYLRNNAYARLYFITYIALLHFWVFFVIMFHAHSFEEVHGDHLGVPMPGGPPVPGFNDNRFMRRSPGALGVE